MKQAIKYTVIGLPTFFLLVIIGVLMFPSEESNTNIEDGQTQEDESTSGKLKTFVNREFGDTSYNVSYNEPQKLALLIDSGLLNGSAQEQLSRTYDDMVKFGEYVFNNTDASMIQINKNATLTEESTTTSTDLAVMIRVSKETFESHQWEGMNSVSMEKILADQAEVYQVHPLISNQTTAEVLKREVDNVASVEGAEVTLWDADGNLVIDSGREPYDVIINGTATSCFDAKQQLLDVMSSIYSLEASNSINWVQYTAIGYLQARLDGDDGRKMVWDFGPSLLWDNLSNYNDGKTWGKNIGNC